MNDLAWALGTLGVILVVASVAQYSMKDSFGERVAANLERSGMAQAASRWNHDRGHRASVVGALIFAGLGICLLLSAALIAILG